MQARDEIKAVNGIGPSAGMSPRDYLRQRDARRASAIREAGMFASAAREIARLRRAGK